MVVTRCDWFVTFKKASVSFSESFTSLMKTWSDQKCWKNDLKAQMFTLRASKIWIIWRQSSECLCKKFWVDVGSTPEADRNQTDRLWRSHVHSERSLNCVCSILQHSDILRGNATETSINSSLIFTHSYWYTVSEKKDVHRAEEAEKQHRIHSSSMEEKLQPILVWGAWKATGLT